MRSPCVVDEKKQYISMTRVQYIYKYTVNTAVSTDINQKINGI